MDWRIAIVLLAFLLGGCASLSSDNKVVAAMASPEATIGCQAADAVTTSLALKYTTAHEANPLMSGVIKNLGIPGLIAIKVALVWWLLTRSDEEVPPVVKAGINVATCGVAASNVAVGLGALPK